MAKLNAKPLKIAQGEKERPARRRGRADLSRLALESCARAGTTNCSDQPRMSASVNCDSTFPPTSRNSQRRASRDLPAVQPSMRLNARNKFQSRIDDIRARKRSALYLPLASNWRYKA